jgi:streptogramin lyase
MFDGGGYRAGGKMGVDGDGNIWAGDNWTIGSQGQDALWQGNLSEFAPNGRPLSPMTTGFTGGGLEGVPYGLAIDARGNVWADSYGSQSISVFDKHGKPLTPSDGITFNHQLGLLQGIIVTPNGDVWVLGIAKNQLVYFPKGDWTNGRIVCEGRTAAPCSEMAGPFHLAIDQQDRIWVDNAFGDMVTRFPASDPSKVETFKTGGLSGSGMNIDSQGNVWVTNRISGSPQGVAAWQNIMKALKASGGYSDWPLVSAMGAQITGGGSVTLFKPDGTQAPGSPFSGPSLPGPWAVAVDGNDQVWISNFAAPWGQIAHLCGVRTETCPPGMKTGDPISPPLGYVGGGLQMMVDIVIDPAGNVWAGNNWQDYKQCEGTPVESLSTRCGGQGVVVFYGMAKPVRTPMIGQAKPF